MRKISAIFLLNLMIVPLYWNGISFMHYLVDHTHTFCASEEDHEHVATGDCHTICHLTPDHTQDQLPNKVEFYELKQCISSLSFFDMPFAFSLYISIHSDYSSLYGRILSKDIFRPPIS